MQLQRYSITLLHLQHLRLHDQVHFFRAFSFVHGPFDFLDRNECSLLVKWGNDCAAALIALVEPKSQCFHEAGSLLESRNQRGFVYSLYASEVFLKQGLSDGTTFCVSSIPFRQW